MLLKNDIVHRMHEHALREYPDECCGIIAGTADRQVIHECENIQNRLHNEDPSRYPRDARTAYAIDREVFDRIISTSEQQGESVIAFYHSHPEHDAFFSEEDHAAQTVLGEPEFPHACQIVISVFDRQIRDTKIFQWDSMSKRFQPVEPG